MQFHDLKIWPEFYQPILDDIKRFETRRNDRDFKLGDILHLQEWHDGAYTGRHSYWRVTYIIYKGPGLQDGYVQMAISGPWGCL
ncbi:MAG: DUF3850 domain-containing protein [bacterium]